MQITTQQPLATPSAGLLQVQALPLTAAAGAEGALLMTGGSCAFPWPEQQPEAGGGATAGFWLPEQQPPEGAGGGRAGAPPVLQQPPEEGLLG